MSRDVEAPMADQRSQNRPSRAISRAKLGLAAALLLGWAGNLADGFNEDELQHLHAAWLVGTGSIPYRDYFDHHPPLFHVVASPLALAMDAQFGQHLMLSRLIGLAIAAGIAVLFARLTPSGRSRGIALAAGTLLVVSRPSDILFYFRPDSIAMLLVLAAVLLVLRPGCSGISGLAAGLCVGTAMFFTQKVAALAPAFVLWMAIRAVANRASRKQIILAGFAFLGGAVVVVASALGLLASVGALQGFLDGPIGFGSHWKQPDDWRDFAQEPVLLGFGAVALGAAWSVRSIVTLLRRGSESWSGDALLGMLALLGLAGFLTTPAPTPQAYFMTAHVWLLAGAVRFVMAWHEAVDPPVSRSVLVAGVIGGLLMLTPVNAAVAILVWGLLFLLWRRASSSGRERAIPAAIACLGAAAAVAFVATQADRVARGTVFRQLRSLARIDGLIPPGGQALTTWPVLTPTRPHATYHWFSDIGMYTSLPRQTLEEEYLGALRDPQTAIAVCDPSVIEKMLPRVWSILERDFQDSGLPPDGLRGARVFVRRTEDRER